MAYGQTGIDKRKVSSSLDAVNQTYGDVVKALTTTNYQTFVEPMSRVWGSPQAVQFFGTYQRIINEMQGEITKIFTSVVESLNGAAGTFAKISGSDWTEKTIETTSETLDVSCVKEMLGDGSIGIDLERANGLLPQLDTILSNVNRGLEAGQSVLRDSGFTGGTMQESLDKSFSTIRDNIVEGFTEIKSQATKAIEETANLYTTAADKISDAFNGNSGV